MYEPYEEKLLNVTRHFAASMSAEKSIVLLYWKKVEMLQSESLMPVLQIHMWFTA